LKIVFLSYRDWAKKALSRVSLHPRISHSVQCHDLHELNKLKLEDFDLLITLGWSDELGELICSSIDAIGLHCAELDRYSYGSPLQLQIIDGITITKHRIFPFIWDPISERAHTHSREYSHETSLSLHGNIEDIFEQLTSTSILLFNQYLDDFPNISWKKWPEEQEVRKKRNPIDSKVLKENLNSMSTLDMYNLIRCLGDPYPNAYIEDEKGTLYFERVRFVKK
jgi:methionyl-tRNA formyltransferase